MERFIFKLQPLLRAREIAERQAQRDVAILQRRWQSLTDSLRKMQDSITDQQHQWRGSLVGTLNAPGLRLAAGASLETMRHANRIVVELAHLQKELTESRHLLAGRSRDRRAVEVLRERRWRAFKTAELRAQDRELDDLVTNRMCREAP
jgi:flagellar export protein FliJ